MTIILLIALLVLIPFAPVVCVLKIPLVDEAGQEYKGIHCHTTFIRGCQLKIKCHDVRIIPAFLV